MLSQQELAALTPDDRALAIQLEQLEVERAKLALESERVAAERERSAAETKKAEAEAHRARWTALATILPVAATALTLLVSTSLQARQVQTQTDATIALKAAEWLVTSTAGPDEVAERARALGDLFPDAMPPALVTKIKANPYIFRDSGIEAKLKFFEAVSRDHSATDLVSTWSKLFPCDWWLQQFEISIPASCGIENDGPRGWDMAPPKSVKP